MYRTTLPSGSNIVPWSPETATGLVGKYANHGIYGSATAILPVVFDNAIHLFYWKEDTICHAVFDGTTWTARPPIPGAYRPFGFAVATAKSGRPVLCFGGVQLSATEPLVLTLIRAGDGVVEPGPIIELEQVQSRNYFGAAWGTLAGGTQANVIQVFGNNTNRMSPMRCCEVNIETNGVSPWSYTGLFTESNGFYPIAVAECSVVQAVDNKSFRKYLQVSGQLLHTSNIGTYVWEETFASYSSDYFECLETEGKVLNTAATEEKGSWLLIGVIEGVPPFTRNGSILDQPKSEVTYARSKEESAEIYTQFDTHISLMAGASMEGVFDVSATVDTAFGTVYSQTTVNWTTVTKEFSNERTGDNRDGEWGSLLIAKPTLTNYPYACKSQDQSQVLSRYNVLQVTNVTIEAEPYLLEAPPPGMKVRERSSHPGYWSRQSLASIRGFKSVEHNTLTSNTIMDKDGVELGKKETSTLLNTSKVSLELSAEVSVEFFKFGMSGGFSYECGVSFSTQMSEACAASILKLPAASGVRWGVTSLKLTPYYYEPKPNLMLASRAEKPFWVPDLYFQKNYAPWCLSWGAKLSPVRIDGTSLPVEVSREVLVSRRNELRQQVAPSRQREQEARVRYEAALNDPFNYVFYIENIALPNHRMQAVSRASIGVELQPKDGTNDHWQRWKLIPNGGKYTIRNMAFGDGSSVEVALDDATHPLKLRTTTGAANQTFGINQISGPTLLIWQGEGEQYFQAVYVGYYDVWVSPKSDAGRPWQMWQLIRTQEPCSTLIDELYREWQAREAELVTNPELEQLEALL